MPKKPKKHLGQHFLTAPAIAAKIAGAVPAKAGDNVLEIGPGRGAMSVHLVKRFANMHFVEVDKDAVEILKEKLNAASGAADNAFNNDSQNFTVHNENFMTFDMTRLPKPFHVCGNLPYNIGAHIIKKCLFCAPDVLSVTFMVQREVAERIVSPPHKKQNGFLSIFCQFFGEAKILFHVPPGAFFPKPNVDSSVFQIILNIDVERKLDRGSWEEFFAFVDCGFSMKRKQLAKTMSVKLGGDKKFYGDILAGLNLDALSRPEDLSADDWLNFFARTKMK